MSEDRIVRKDLWSQLSKVRKVEEWLRVAKRLDLEVTQPKGGSSHYAIRLKGHEKGDIRGLVSTVFAHGSMRKDVNEKVFKAFLDKGFKEDDVWRALKMLKD